MRWSAVRSASIALALLGIAGWGAARYRVLERTLPAQANHPLLRLDGAEGRSFGPGVDGRIELTVGDRVRFLRAEDDNCRFTRVLLVGTRQGQGSSPEIHFRERDGQFFLLRASAAADGGIILAFRNDKGETIGIRDRREPDLVGPPYKPCSIEIRFQGDAFAVRVNGQDALEMPHTSWTDGELSIGAVGQSFQLSGLSVEGTIREPARGNVPFSETFDFNKPPGTKGSPFHKADPLPALAREAAWMLGALLAAALLLHAFCLGDPGALRLLRATLVLFGPAGIYFATGLFRPVEAATPWLVLLLPIGLFLALHELRLAIPGPTSRRRPVVGRALLALATFALVLWCHDGYRARALAALDDLESAALARAVPAAPDPKSATRLDASNASVFEGRWRDFDLHADVDFHEGVFQARLRALRTEWPEGLSLILSHDPAFRSGFFLESREAFEPVGPAIDLAADDAGKCRHDVVVRARGREFTALVDGVERARVDVRPYAEGPVVLLAAAGRAIVESASLAPLPHAAPPSAALERLLSAVVTLSPALLYAALLALLLGLPFVAALFAAACAYGPVAVFLAGAEPTGAFDVWPAVAALGAGSFVALLFPLLHPRRLSGPKYLLVLLLVAAVAIRAYAGLRERAWPPDDAAVNALSVADWSGDRIEPRYLHLQHPLVRRWNPWLADHQLRGRYPALEKPQGVTRILSLGTSSTYGYRADEPYGFRVERMLKEEGRNVEVIVGAWPGASGARILPFLRNVLLQYQPDVVVLSLYHNDTAALSQADEPEYFERITADGYQRGPIERLKDAIAVSAGARQYARWQAQARTAQGLAGDDPALADPPRRYEAMLRGFAQLARDRGFKLVFVHEPVVGKEPTLFRAEFKAAMVRVGTEFRIAVVDPEPEILAAGGASLFMDRVHPYDSGHEVIAKALLPALRAALDS